MFHGQDFASGQMNLKWSERNAVPPFPEVGDLHVTDVRRFPGSFKVESPFAAKQHFTFYQIQVSLVQIQN